MKQINVAIVEGNSCSQKNMTSFLNCESDIVVTGVAADKKTAVSLAKTNLFDIFVMGLEFSGNKDDAFQTVAEITRSSRSKVIMLSSNKEEKTIMDSFTAGVANYIMEERYADIPNEIRATFSNSSVVEVLAKGYIQLKQQEKLNSLTPSEREVYNLLEKGFPKSKIQEKLIKSDNTIKTQVRQVIKKLEAKNIKEAVAKIKAAS